MSVHTCVCSYNHTKMLLKFLNGDLLTIENHTDHTYHTISQLVRQHIPNIEPSSQLILVSEDLSDADRELGVTFCVLIKPRHTIYLLLNFDHHSQSSCSACELCELDNIRWLRVCQNEDILTKCLQIGCDIKPHLFANPHSMIVDHIFHTGEIRSIFISANSSDRVLDYLFDRHPDLVSFPHLLINPNPRAIHYFFQHYLKSRPFHELVVQYPYIVDIVKWHGEDQVIMDHVFELLDFFEVEEWPLGLLESPHDDVIERCLANLHKFESGWSIHVSEFGCNRRVLMEAIAKHSQHIPKTWWSNPHVDSDMINSVFQSPPSQPSNEVVQHLVQNPNLFNTSFVDQVTSSLKNYFPYVLANSHPKMVEIVIEWLETHSNTLKELMKQSLDMSWWYGHYAKRNTNIDFIMYVWRKWPEFRWSDLNMMMKMSVTNDVHIQFE